MRLGGYKLQIDGSALTAYCHEATKGSRWDMPAWPEDIYKKAVKAFHDTGLQVCVHCVGDAAVDLTLDAFEEAMNANPRPDPRHRIEHCCLTKPETTQRIKDLGVVVSNTPAFIRMVGDFFVDVFGDNRYDRIIVEREWLEAGVPMALGSDYPSTPWIQPQMTMASAIARKTASQKTLNPEQCMTFEEALRAHTIGSAYAGFEEGLKGSLEPGKLADLAVWTQDPSAMDSRQLVNATIDMTYVRGKMLYSVSA
jgi:predicted amidohydrolase YtcJ